MGKLFGNADYVTTMTRTHLLHIRNLTALLLCYVSPTGQQVVLMGSRQTISSTPPRPQHQSYSRALHFIEKGLYPKHVLFWLVNDLVM